MATDYVNPPEGGMSAGGPVPTVVAVFKAWDPDRRCTMGGPDLAFEQAAGATTAVTDTRMTIAVVGELDLARECELLNLVLTLELRPGTTIELDLSEVTFVDSYGLNSIIKADAYLRGIRCELILVRSQPQLLRLMELVGLAERLVKQDDGR